MTWTTRGKQSRRFTSSPSSRYPSPPSLRYAAATSLPFAALSLSPVLSLLSPATRYSLGHCTDSPQHHHNTTTTHTHDTHDTHTTHLFSGAQVGTVQFNPHPSHHSYIASTVRCARTLHGWRRSALHSAPDRRYDAIVPGQHKHADLESRRPAIRAPSHIPLSRAASARPRYVPASHLP